MEPAGFSKQPPCNGTSRIFLTPSAISRSSWRGAGFEHQRAGPGARAGAGGCSSCAVLEPSVPLAQIAAHGAHKPWEAAARPCRQRTVKILCKKSCVQQGEKSSSPSLLSRAQSPSHQQHAAPCPSTQPPHRAHPTAEGEAAETPNFWGERGCEASCSKPAPPQPAAPLPMGLILPPRQHQRGPLVRQERPRARICGCAHLRWLLFIYSKVAFIPGSCKSAAVSHHGHINT